MSTFCELLIQTLKELIKKHVFKIILDQHPLASSMAGSFHYFDPRHGQEPGGTSVGDPAPPSEPVSLAGNRVPYRPTN
jgi:hypothetical protein